ncbi:MAG TPA: DHHA1 domain-containing protein [Terriglobia bacterium]|nr:DHHA1 domain-containing protein [Terriglobia bacterium]
MQKTRRLYYTDSYLREFEARVLKSEPGPKGFRVYLDRTAFYPESGGQPMDFGTLGGIPVVALTEEEDAVVHELERPPERDTVQGKIDWPRRFDHMQQHTGQHVLSAAFEKTGHSKTVSFHLGAEASSIDLDSDRLGRRQIEEGEDLANQIVFENREVKIFFRSAAEARLLDMRKPALREGDVRLVEVFDFDLSACGGTHVSRTGAVGLIAVRKVERMKALTRVEFVCGGRALAASRRDYQILSEASKLLSASSAQLPALVAKQMEEVRATHRAREKWAERMAKIYAGELWQAATEKNGLRIIRRVFDEDEHQEGKEVAHKIAARPSAIALIGVKGKAAFLYFSQTPGGAADMGAILKQTMAKFGGKGGGARDFAQGGGMDASRLDEVLAFAESLL